MHTTEKQKFLICIWCFLQLHAGCKKIKYPPKCTKHAENHLENCYLTRGQRLLPDTVYGCFRGQFINLHCVYLFNTELSSVLSLAVVIIGCCFHGRWIANLASAPRNYNFPFSEPWLISAPSPQPARHGPSTRPKKKKLMKKLTITGKLECFKYKFEPISTPLIHRSVFFVFFVVQSRCQGLIVFQYTVWVSTLLERTHPELRHNHIIIIENDLMAFIRRPLVLLRKRTLLSHTMSIILLIESSSLKYWVFTLFFLQVNRPKCI